MFQVDKFRKTEDIAVKELIRMLEVCGVRTGGNWSVGEIMTVTDSPNSSVLLEYDLTDSVCRISMTAGNQFEYEITANIDGSAPQCIRTRNGRTINITVLTGVKHIKSAILENQVNFEILKNYHR